MKAENRHRKEQGVTLREKLIVYFVVNRDEELTMLDIADKYERCQTHVGTTIRRMKRAGLLATKGDTKRNAPLVAGPELLALAGSIE